MLFALVMQPPLHLFSATSRRLYVRHPSTVSLEPLVVREQQLPVIVDLPCWSAEVTLEPPSRIIQTQLMDVLMVLGLFLTTPLSTESLSDPEILIKLIHLTFYCREEQPPSLPLSIAFQLLNPELNFSSQVMLLTLNGSRLALSGLRIMEWGML